VKPGRAAILARRFSNDPIGEFVEITFEAVGVIEFFELASVERF
jgi:hypothetical protein